MYAVYGFSGAELEVVNREKRRSGEKERECKREGSTILLYEQL